MRRFTASLLSGLVVLQSLLALTPSSARAMGANLVANQSVETANLLVGSPQSWLTDQWGKNTASFTYPQTGYLSGRSVRVDVSGFRNGDAKWYFEPVAVLPGTDYTYTDYYQSSVRTPIVAMSLDSAGTPTYLSMATGLAISNGTWKLATARIHTPANAVRLTVFHLLNKNGWLQIDNVSLTQDTGTPPPVVTPPPVTPPAPIVTLTASPTAITTGQSSTLSWSATNTPTNCTASGDWTGVQTTSGSASTGILVTARTYSYTLACSNAGGSSSATATVVASAPVVTPPVTPPTDCGLLPNCSVETVSTGNAQLPEGWVHGQWGTNTPVYEYSTTGRTGSRSLKLTMTNYSSGDAKWMFSDQALARGGSYRFSVWYKTNVIPHVVAQYTHDNGTESFFGLPDPQPDGNGNWQFYSDTFNVPSTVRGVSVFLFLTGNGWVQTDDYAITPYQPVGFSRPLVSLTFDDGFEGNVRTILPVLGSYGFKSTQCYATSFVEGLPTQVQNVQTFKNAGHEICSHTVTHPFLTQLPTTTLVYELTHSRDFLASITGAPVLNFASPYGDYNASVNSEIRKLYRSHRTVDEGYNSKDNFDPYRIRVQNMFQTTTIAQYNEWLATAKATNTWLVLVYHVVDTTGLGQYDTNSADFAQQMAALAASGITVKTYNSALDELIPQL